MPKVNSGRIADAQRQRQNISKKSEKYGPSTVYLQVLGSGARGAPNTLYLFTDQKRYLFNCGECTQRLAHEHKVKLSRLDHIFITSKTWRNIGGLPGLSLTLQDVGVPNITLHGPEGLDDLYNATKRFVIMKDMQVTMAKCSPSEDFEDSVMTVKYILLPPVGDILPKESMRPAAKRPKLEDALAGNKQFEEFIHDETDYYRPDQAKKPKPIKQKALYERSADAMKKKTEKALQDLQKKGQCVVSYICTLKKRLGTLDLAKCVELGVKPGPLLGQLKSGHDVVLQDGTLVLSKDVKTPDDPGPVFIVLDVPAISYLREAEFAAHFDDGTKPENVPALIVHFTPPHVFHHPTYKAFMTMFGPTTRHLVLNSQNSCLGSEAVHRTQHKLHLLDPDIFPILRDVSIQAEWSVHPPVPKTNSPVRLKGLEELKNRVALAQFQNIINMEGSCKGDGGAAAEEGDASSKLETYSARTLTMFHLRPKKHLDRSAEPKLHVQDYIQETMDVDGFVTSLEHCRGLVEGVRYAKSDSQQEFPKVVFLGTGSCIPSKTRNTSGIIIQIDEQRSILLDCGEGTFGQLVRFYGPKRVNSILRTLKAIYISHLHADHHIGLIGVLQGRMEALNEVSEDYDPIYLLAPGQIVTWLSLYDYQFEKIRSEFTLIPNQSLMEDAKSREMTPAVLASIGLDAIRTCLVPHCPNAFGVAITIAGRKITYSGDTLPTEQLVKIGEDSTILIHEATMEDELAEEARIKMHSTTSQAIDIGKQMRAKYTVLTHFSQRYARLPRLNAHILNDNNTVGIAFDNMQITMGDLELLPLMYAPLQLMFAEHCVEMELKAAQRARLKEKRASLPSIAGGHSGANVSQAASMNSRSSARYRESKSSRLRQEMKGMTLSGFVQAPRSKSSSPTKSSSRQSSYSRSQGSASATSRSIPEKGVDVTSTLRTPSESSGLSREAHEFLRAVSNTPSGSLVDSRSKIISTTNVVGAREFKPNKSPRRASSLNRTPQTTSPITSSSAASVESFSGYGKPLVTPVTKRLAIRRDIRLLATQETAKNIGKDTTKINRIRSPIRSWKAENRQSPEVASKRIYNTKFLRQYKLDVISSVVLHLVFWRFAQIGSTLVGHRHWVVIVVIVLFWTATVISGVKAMVSHTKQSVAGRRAPPATVPAANAPRSLSSTYRSFNGSPTSRSSLGKPDSKYSTKCQLGKQSNNQSAPIINRNVHCKSRLAKDCVRKPVTLIKPIQVMGRPNSGAYSSSKSFKPQLEDIKSSYLLLNSHKKNNPTVKNGSAEPLIRPKPLNELQRRTILNESKKKFQSQSFRNDSRYDKIEGLNWISWK